jgi:hypothetical protein
VGLISVILGTASGAQNVGLFGALGVGAYIALAGLWGSPISGASMNPARTFGPDLVGGNFSHYLVYVAGPIAGAAVATVIDNKNDDASTQIGRPIGIVPWSGSVNPTSCTAQPTVVSGRVFVGSDNERRMVHKEKETHRL